MAGKMFSAKSKLSVDLIPQDPVFYAQYLGKMEIASFRRRELIISAVEQLINRGMKVNLGNLPRVSMTFNPFLIHMIDSSAGKPNHKYEFSFRLSDISYCMANSGMKRIFAWVVTDPEGIKRPRVHAVLCGTEDVARIMALLMTEYFNVAYKDHKTAQGRKQRQRKLNHRLEGLRLHQAIEEVTPSPGGQKGESSDQAAGRLKSDSRNGGGQRAVRRPSFPPKARPRPRLPMMMESNSSSGPAEWSTASSALARSKSTSAADPMRPPERTSSFSHQIAKERYFRQAMPYDPDTSDAKSIKDATNTLRRLKVDPAKWEQAAKSEVDSLFDWVNDE